MDALDSTAHCGFRMPECDGKSRYGKDITSDVRTTGLHITRSHNTGVLGIKTHWPAQVGKAFDGRAQTKNVVNHASEVCITSPPYMVV